MTLTFHIAVSIIVIASSCRLAISFRHSAATAFWVSDISAAPPAPAPSAAPAAAPDVDAAAVAASALAFIRASTSAIRWFCLRILSPAPTAENPEERDCFCSLSVEPKPPSPPSARFPWIL